MKTPVALLAILLITVNSAPVQIAQSFIGNDFKDADGKQFVELRLDCY